MNGTVAEKYSHVVTIECQKLNKELFTIRLDFLRAFVDTHNFLTVNDGFWPGSTCVKLYDDTTKIKLSHDVHDERINHSRDEVRSRP
jgi:hypothetical protein